MRNGIRRGIAFFLAVLMVCLVPFTGGTVYASEGNGEQTVEKATIWVVGDSTVSAFEDKYYYPRYGWGTQLTKFFDASKYEVRNIALSGRSSKSYIEEGEYKTLLTEMKKGDYLFIGFGHNDEKTEEARYTNPNGDYTVKGSFANSLYENYIKPAQTVGCMPVLMTPIVRRTESTFSDSQLHITSTSVDLTGVTFEGGDYPEAIRSLGKDVSVPVVDLTKETKELYTTLTPSGTLYLHAWTSKKENSVDNTHTNIYGATYNGYLIAKAIRELKVEGLADGVVDSMIEQAPEKEVYLKSNPDYKEKEYNSDLRDSELWSNQGIWKGTVFGDVGGVPTKDNFSLGSDEAGNMNIAVSGGKGKIAGSTDGLAMYYYKVPVGKPFTLTATATVNRLDTGNNQVAFGLMARDDMYIDEYINTTLGDYVVAGPVKLAAGAWNCFARKSGTLTQGGTAENKIALHDTIDLKLSGNSDGYTCTFGKEQTISGGFDFQLTSIDSDYVYVGMFAARNADITYSNIKLVVDGKEVTGQVEESKPEESKPEESKPEESKPEEKPSTPVTPSEPVKPSEPAKPTTEVKPATPAKPVTLARVTKVKASAVKTDSAKISWNKVSNADKYQIQVYENKKWKSVKTTSATSATLSKLHDGTNYKVRVRACKSVSGKTVYGSYSANITVTTKTRAPKFTVKTGRRTATVSVGKVTGANGYVVYRSTKKSSGFRTLKTMKQSSSRKYTSIRLKNKVYYYKVRSYKIVNGKRIYSAYSSTKRVVIK